MKIVCEACQAKYSISDDKVRGKAFKIRCKKCSHIIVVRSADAGASSGSSPAISTSPPADNSWHIVVDGEQVGPLSASDIRGRLSRGEISGETYIWREGLADWLKVSAIPDFAGTEQGEEDGSSPFPSSPAASAYPPGTAESAFAAPGGDADVFASPNPSSSNMAADLFASPASSPEPEHKGPSSSSYSSFGAQSESNHRVSGNGAGAGMATSPAGLTGQRHENSVLFSLSNLEALASPNSPGSAVPRPGVSSGSSEGSGLIDIRSMAAMTLGSTAEPRPSADLPTFGAPQFSPVAPVLLPIGSSGPPKWIYAVLALLVVLAAGFSFMAYKVFFPNKAVVRAPAPVAPIAAPVAPAPPKAPVATAPPTTPPPSPTEALPPREDKPGGEKVVKANPPRGGSRTPRAPKGPRSGGSDVQGGVAVAPPTSTAPEKPNVGKQDKLDELLSAAMGTKNKPSGGGRPPADDEPVRKAAPAAAALPTLGKEDIVRAMMGVQGKVKDCFNQYKVPGTAMVSLNVARGGRVTTSNVTGKFAGTPTGVCVAAAVKSAKFPPCEASDGLAYAFALH